ncbi:baseplate assembly protein [Martelella alba]|uniref:Baseplate assembly protein n=1 Tax=Martelella alba TaxID=2590451 RepID=A0ABY2SGL2_9HYPH|nr:baseplate assembly protein [Martelella alba]TKI03588.1 baseplate assembly protein [Martelella alba]
MRALLNAMTRNAAQAQAGVAGPRQGIITAYDPDVYAVKVQIQPTGEETGWIPLSTDWVGNGWGLAAGPMIGAIVGVDFDSGLMGAGMATGQYYNDVDRCPGPPSGEFWLVHKDGAYIKLTNDKKVTIVDGAGSSLVMNGDTTGEMSFAGGLTVNADMQINGNVTASGDISDQNGERGTVQHIRDEYNAHGHPGVESGDSTTDTPNNTL